MKRVSTLSTWVKLAVIPLAGLLAACSSSSSDDGTDTTTVTGSVTAAPVNGASVLIKDAAGNTLAGPVTTATDGSYTLRIDNASLGSDLLLESSGGSYTDEATGLSVTAGTLSAYVAGGSLSATAQVHMTPASTIVSDLVRSHGMSLSAAQAAFESAFGFAADTTEAPVDAASTPPAGASEAQLLAGLRAAAFSQLTMDLGLTTSAQFDLLTALAEDLADGSLDGTGTNGAVTVAGSTPLPVDIQNRFTLAMEGFHAGANNQTGLSNDKIGTLPFAKLALTDSYKVEYLPGMMAAMEGKTTFKLRVSNIADDTPASGLSVSLMPMMYMSSGMMHGSPSGGCSENTTTAGDYDCTVYYLMGSSMSNGMSMGYWQLTAMIGGMMGESVTFSPSVMMAMGDTAKVTLRGQADMIEGMAMDGGMAMAENRSYYLFKDSLSGMTGNHTLKLFVAAKESMMSYKGVSAVDGTVLNSGDATYELTVMSMSVEVSTNPTDPTSWIAASDDGNGLWTAAGITGLTDGTAGSVSVRLTINGEQKTGNGLAPAGDGSNDYGTFTLTPGGM